jgi:hypothetical protein
VKTLREPQDIVRTVAVKFWNERRRADPDKYNFPVLVTCSPRGVLSNKAISRIKEIIDLLPSTKKTFIEDVLDGNMKIRIEKIDVSGKKTTSPPVDLESVLISQLIEGKEQSRIVIQMPITENDWNFDLAGFQRFFIKALKTVVDSTPKFFGHAAEEGTLNLLVLQWEPPEFIVPVGPTEFVERAIGRLFSRCGLNLKLMIFHDQPEVPTSILRRSRIQT